MLGKHSANKAIDPTRFETRFHVVPDPPASPSPSAGIALISEETEEQKGYIVYLFLLSYIHPDDHVQVTITPSRLASAPCSLIMVIVSLSTLSLTGRLGQPLTFHTSVCLPSLFLLSLPPAFNYSHVPLAASESSPSIYDISCWASQLPSLSSLHPESPFFRIRSCI